MKTTRATNPQMWSSGTSGEREQHMASRDIACVCTFTWLDIHIGCFYTWLAIVGCITLFVLYFVHFVAIIIRILFTVLVLTFLIHYNNGCIQMPVLSVNLRIVLVLQFHQ